MEMLINSKHISTEERMEVTNPYDNSIVDTIPVADEKIVHDAIKSAKNSKNKMTNLSSREIYYRLTEACTELKEQKEDIAKIITKETGKPINGSLYELDRSIETLMFAAEESKRVYGENVPIDAGLGGEGVMAFTKKIPLGVVAAITPFNYPVNLAIHKLAPALAARNTVILKPSKEAPLSGLMLAEILANHFPEGVINTLTGSGKLIGDLLVTNDDINKISFTGSVPIGTHIAKNAGMKKLTLELGGNDPTIVLKDADIEKAVSDIVNGAYLFSGQVCMGVKRVIVERDIIDEFTENLVKQTGKLKVGNPMNKDTDIGPLINTKAVEYVNEVVNDAVSNGANVEIGAKVKNNFYWPTVLTGIKEDMKIVSNETFGPIAPIIEAQDIDEAINIANNSKYGLNAGVFTENIHSALKCVNSIESGSVFVNKASTFRTDNMPFGGFKNSGMGKEGIKYAVEDMCKTKLIGFNLN
ncbi:lactaldehyde dehydrogenase [Methanosphaera sp.]|uniref:lactaldehyde dehydrogenase n=1 Tax=Methanosphaera sp. TaxID=2666342 RepID=UPI002E7A483B|nr:lactaldehyde dehydrogenase [Methanosphaera sp.]MEE1118172.1 lactaldehyde dehydrogenase [Methanosphaera sp.]